MQIGAETDGELLSIECFNLPPGWMSLSTSIPRQDSRAQMISGARRLRVRGEIQEVGSGESHTIPAEEPHSFGNYGDEEAHWINGIPTSAAGR